MDPYRPPSSDRSGKMRLDFNENTVGCSPRVLRRLKKIAAGDLAVYPEYDSALPRFAVHFQVAPDQMTLTNGTDEAIQLVINTYVKAGDPVVILRPSYAMYRFYAQVAGASVEEVDYLPDLSFPEKDLLRKLTRRTKAILVANPNNPTGTLASSDQLRAVLEAAPHTAVLVDEAYFEFSDQTVLSWISDFPNLFVSRTFSKVFGLAALRLGCLFSQAGNISAIRKGQSPYSVNGVAVALGLEAILDKAFVGKYVAEVLRARRMLCGELDLLGLKYYPSSANFVLVDFGGAARQVRDLLAEKGILVRDRSYELPGCVRITVGTMAQTRKLTAVLRQAWQGIRDSRRKNGNRRAIKLA
ncbi:MAG: histidinol-phosphate transaminase [Acidobacteria bacterium]|nr:histidinol-phosphate transaminase [Acidobacteriota bacterium]